MLGIQFAIGAVNDLADAPRDALARPTKPIPSGAVSVGRARLVALAAATTGLGLAAVHGPTTLVIAALGLGLGLAYDLVLKPTPLSWLPFALGIPLVPLFAWAGAAGTVPAPVLVLALLAVPAGAGVAVANALADVDDDRAAGTRTVATALGPARAWWAATALLAGAWGAAVVALTMLGGGMGILRAAGSGAPGPGAGTDPLAVVGWVAIVASALLIAVGAALGRGPAAARRRAGWGVEAIGVVILGCGWVAVLEATDRLIA
jgi:4-hydroxybenzoate polyprenyltransferase